MAQQDIKQIRGASQGSILFLGTNSVISEEYDKLNWDQSNNIFTINGNIKITDGNQTDGYILKTDANGLGTWVDPSSISANGTGSTGLGTYWTSNNELGFMNIGVSQSTGDVRYIDFDTTVINDVSPGRLSWNAEDGTLNIGLDNDVTLQVGQESHFRVKNQTGATISNGRLVSAVGTLGSSGRILASYSIADGSVPARYIIGVATSDIIDGADGYVTEFGLVRGIDATGTPYGETWNNGDVLWANPNIVGGLTKFEPIGGNTGVKVEVALVVDNVANGSIFVRVTNGFKLHELHDVEYDESQLTDDSILRWNTTGQYWTYSTNSFENLSDTNIISATTNDTLRYDGTDWVNNSFVTADSSGTFSINGTFVYVDGNQQPGYVLTSDGGGIASWSQSQGATSSIGEIIISGTQNGTNRDFVMSESLVTTQNMFFINGQLLTEPTDYIISGTALTIDTGYPAPITSDVLRLFGTINDFAIIGPQGEIGPTGSQGEIGPTGATGADSFVPGPTGPTGSATGFSEVSLNSGVAINLLPRATLNFIEGPNISLTIVDDAGGDEVDITIESVGGSSRITSTVSTTNNTPTELEKIISITDNTTSIIEVYVKAYQASATQYGVWKRTLTVTKVSGVVTIRQVNADVDKTSSGLNANSISFTVNAGDIDLDVTGIAATTIDWESAYEIIL